MAEETTPVEQPVEVEQPKQDENAGTQIESMMIDFAKRYNGYPYVSAARLNKDYPKDSKEQSFILKNIMFQYITRGGSNEQEFADTFAKGDLVIICVHSDLPKMAKDGLYDSITVTGKWIKTIPVGTFRILNPETFQPCIIKKMGPNNYGKIVGDPYHNITEAEAHAVLAAQIERDIKEGKIQPLSDSQS